MIKKIKNINDVLRVTYTNRKIEYFCKRNDAGMSFHPRDKYKMIKVIQIILNENMWREGSRAWGAVTDTSRYGSVYKHLLRAGLNDIDYFGNNWYRIDLTEVLSDLKLSIISTDILKEKNIDKLKEMLKGMTLDELIYLRESGAVNE